MKGTRALNKGNTKMGLDEEIARIKQQSESAASDSSVAAGLFRQAFQLFQVELHAAAHKLAAADVPVVPVLAMTEDPREGDAYRFRGPVDHGKQAWPIGGELGLTRDGVLLRGLSRHTRHPSMETSPDRRYSGLWKREASIGLEPGEMYLGYFAGQMPEVDLDASRPVLSRGRADISPQEAFPFSLQNNVLFYQNPSNDEVATPALEILATGVVSLLEKPPVRRPPLAERRVSKRKSSWWRW